MAQSENFPLIAKTMAELEDVLAEELTQLGANDVEIGTRMVSFTGDKALMYKANVHCRTALRILKPIYNFKAETADEVYEELKKLNWEEHLSLDKTFSIDAVVFSHIFTHSKFVAYKVKDAIADWFNEKYGKRPSVSITNPDVVFNIHIAHNKCTLALDSSGESLHKRGYRVAQGDAPLNEVLAAGMILKSGWRGESVFVDPMCGSGTLLIEAAMIALGIPPGIHRENFAFEKWNDFDADLFSEIYNDDSTSREFSHRIVGSDISPKMIAIAEKNIKNAGLQKYIDLSVKPMQQYTKAPAETGVLMTNPPYGERIKVEDLDELYSMIGERLKHVFTGYRTFVLSFKKECFDKIGLKPSHRFFLYNGALECEMREYEIFSGKRDDHPRTERCRPDKEHLERNSKEGYRRSRRSEQGDEEKPQREFRREREFSRDEKPRRDFPKRERTEDHPFKSRERSFNNDRKPRGDRPFDGDRKPCEFKKRDTDRKFDGKREGFKKKEFGKQEKDLFDKGRKRDFKDKPSSFKRQKPKEK
ncbi:MAG: Ribosomal RNA large subunit methyltransferase K [Bacteroidetes bacterium ADurb.BinA174]|nr:MAG: Ribosomal RNA large subunit methyltransferase K [Bacteroidetes bacterium ADurb.BinA174]